LAENGDCGQEICRPYCDGFDWYERHTTEPIFTGLEDAWVEFDAPNTLTRSGGPTIVP
jgi:hypothetical protein